MGTTQTLEQARAGAAQGVVNTANSYIAEHFSAADLAQATLLMQHFLSQQPPRTNAAAALAPLFAFVAEVQRSAQPFVDAARKATTPDGAYAAIAGFDPRAVTPPKIDVWGASYPAN
jgi:hypothetical protein